MFEKHKLEKAAHEYQAALTTWEDENSVLNGLLQLVIKGGGPGGGGPASVPLILKKGEESVFLLTGGGLFEPRRGPGHYQGASQGFSIPIGGSGVRYRIGQSRGTFVQGDENPTIIDSGTVVMTTQRVVFMGAKRTVEWAFSKLVTIQHYQNRPWTAIQVSNRQKVTGITYDVTSEHNLRLRLEAAVALYNQETAELEAQLIEALNAHDAAKPVAPITEVVPPPAVPLPSSPPPGYGTAVPILSATPPRGWYPDPEGRHQYRFWDGTRWSPTVADGGVEGFDPVGPRQS